MSAEYLLRKIDKISLCGECPSCGMGIRVPKIGDVSELFRPLGIIKCNCGAELLLVAEYGDLKVSTVEQEG